jgi:hypothetical protein
MKRSECLVQEGLGDYVKRTQKKFKKISEVTDGQDKI